MEEKFTLFLAVVLVVCFVLTSGCIGNDSEQNVQNKQINTTTNGTNESGCGEENRTGGVCKIQIEKDNETR